MNLFKLNSMRSQYSIAHCLIVGEMNVNKIIALHALASEKESDGK